MRQAQGETSILMRGRIAIAALLIGMAALVVGTGPSALAAQDAQTAQSDSTPQAQAVAPQAKPAARPRGSVTNLPLPRFVSLKANEANLRRGPSLSHRIDWVLKRRGYPLEVIAEYGHWRRVRDIDGATGWIHYTLISGVRMALVADDMVDLHRRATLSSGVVAQAEKGSVLRLLECARDWCRASAGGYKGWVEKRGLWGIYDGETLE